MVIDDGPVRVRISFYFFGIKYRLENPTNRACRCLHSSECRNWWAVNGERAMFRCLFCEWQCSSLLKNKDNEIAHRGKHRIPTMHGRNDNDERPDDNSRKTWRMGKIVRAKSSDHNSRICRHVHSVGCISRAKGTCIYKHTCEKYIPTKLR